MNSKPNRRKCVPQSFVSTLIRPLSLTTTTTVASYTVRTHFVTENYDNRGQRQRSMRQPLSFACFSIQYVVSASDVNQPSACVLPSGCLSEEMQSSGICCKRFLKWLSLRTIRSFSLLNFSTTYESWIIGYFRDSIRREQARGVVYDAPTVVPNALCLS
jgi:hypothetical protein